MCIYPLRDLIACSTGLILICHLMAMGWHFLSLLIEGDMSLKSYPDSTQRGTRYNFVYEEYSGHLRMDLRVIAAASNTYCAYFIPSMF